MSTITVKFYAQVEPTHWSLDGTAREAKVVRITGRRPRDPIGGTLLVALELRVPAEAFEPLKIAPVDVPVDNVVPILKAADHDEH